MCLLFVIDTSYSVSEPFIMFSINRIYIYLIGFPLCFSRLIGTYYLCILAFFFSYRHQVVEAYKERKEISSFGGHL